MHGRLKSAQPRDAESLNALKHKALQYCNAEAALWTLHKQRAKVCSSEEHAGDLVSSAENNEGIRSPTSQDFLAASFKLLKVNPDVYTVWNWRREELILLTQQQQLPSEKIENLVLGELELSKVGIETNPKSYPAWYHRRWVIEWGGPSIVQHGRLNDILRNELIMCSLLLKLDERNFHCWTYRTWVSEQLSLSTKEEFNYTTEKIKENFSNYSAFHRRSQLLTSLAEEDEAAGKVDAQCELLSNELHMARTAYFTEPDDQSAWWYVRFLINWADGSNSKGEGVRFLEKVESKKLLLTPKLRAILEEEVQAIKELLEMEPRSKWARISLVDIFGKLGRIEEAIILCDELIEFVRHHLQATETDPEYHH